MDLCPEALHAETSYCATPAALNSASAFFCMGSIRSSVGNKGGADQNAVLRSMVSWYHEK